MIKQYISNLLPKLFVVALLLILALVSHVFPKNGWRDDFLVNSFSLVKDVYAQCAGNPGPPSLSGSLNGPTALTAGQTASYTVNLNSNQTNLLSIGGIIHLISPQGSTQDIPLSCSASSGNCTGQFSISNAVPGAYKVSVEAGASLCGGGGCFISPACLPGGEVNITVASATAPPTTPPTSPPTSPPTQPPVTPPPAASCWYQQTCQDSQGRSGTQWCTGVLQSNVCTEDIGNTRCFQDQNRNGEGQCLVNSCSAAMPELILSNEVGPGGIKIYKTQDFKGGRKLIQVTRNPVNGLVNMPVITSRTPANAPDITFEQAVDQSGNWYAVIPDNTSATADNVYTLSVGIADQSASSVNYSNNLANVNPRNAEGFYGKINSKFFQLVDRLTSKVKAQGVGITGTISGPATASVGQSVSYTANIAGNNLTRMELAKEGPPANTGNWANFGTRQCSGNSCSLTASTTFSQPGTYTVSFAGADASPVPRDSQCTGSPYYNFDSASSQYHRCGGATNTEGQQYIIVTVTGTGGGR